MYYRYEELGDDDFQRLVQALLAHSLGPGLVAMPLGEADGGRDAQFRAVVFQVKFTRSPETVDDPVAWLLNAVDRERDKIKRLVARGVRTYILVTNVRGTGALDNGTIDRLKQELWTRAEAWGLDEMLSWWRDGVDRRFDAAPASLKLSYAAALPGDQTVMLTLLAAAAGGLLERQAAAWHESGLDEDLLRGASLVRAEREVEGSESTGQVRAFLAASAVLRDRQNRSRADAIISAVDKLPEADGELASAVAQTVIDEIHPSRRARFSLWGLTARPAVSRFLVSTDHLTHVAWPAGGGYRTIDTGDHVSTWDEHGVLLDTRRAGGRAWGSRALSDDGEYIYHCGAVWRASNAAKLADTGCRPVAVWASRGWAARSLGWFPGNRLVVREDAGRFAQLTMRGDQLVRLGETAVADASFVEWSPDGRRLAVTVEDAKGHARLRICSTGDPVRTIRTIGSAGQGIDQAVWSPDGQLLATVLVTRGDDHSEYTVCVHTRGGRHLASWSGASVPNLCWSPDGTLLAAGSGTYRNAVEIRDARSGAQLAEFAFSDRHINDLWWSPDGQTLVAQDPETTCAWRLQRSRTDGTVTIAEAYEPFANHTAITASWEPRQRRAVLRSERTAWLVSRSASPRHLDDDVLDVRFSPAGNLIAAARPDSVRLWSPSGKNHRDISIDGIHRVIWSPDGQRIAMVHVPEQEDALADKILIWDLAGERVDCEIVPHQLQQHPVWSPDGHLLAVPDGAEIVLYGTASGAGPVRLPNPEGTVMSIAWAPSGDRIAAITGNQLMIWNVAHGEPGKVVSRASWQSTLCWSPDGTMLAAALDEGEAGVDVWEIQHGTRYRLHADGLVVELTWTDALRATLSDGQILYWHSPSRVTRHRTRRLTQQERECFGLDPEPTAAIS